MLLSGWQKEGMCLMDEYDGRVGTSGRVRGIEVVLLMAWQGKGHQQSCS